MNPQKNKIGLWTMLICVGIGAGTRFVEFPATGTGTAKIEAPETIEYPGQYCLLRASMPGRSPRSLIYSWSVDSATPISPEHPRPLIHQTPNPAEATIDTVPGLWKVTAAIADPIRRSGQIVSIEIKVPDSVTPGPSPNPKPNPKPNPNPEPSARFAQLTTDVKTWLAAVNSPDKSAEVAAILSGTTEVVTSLRTGPLSHLSGLQLRIAVASAVMGNNSRIKNTAAWSEFGAHVNSAASTAAQANQLNTPADWADFLEAFANGLRTGG